MFIDVDRLIMKSITCRPEVAFLFCLKNLSFTMHTYRKVEKHTETSAHLISG